jgi:hypothetical protein
MIRNWSMHLAALAVLCCLAVPAQATQVDIAMNLFYDNPADQSQGGDWSLVVKTDWMFGVAGFRTVLTELDNFADDIEFPSDTGIINPVNPGGPNERPPFLLLMNDNIDLVYAQDLSESMGRDVVVGVGTPVTSDGPDPFGDPAWDDATIIATGRFGSVRPDFGLDDQGFGSFAVLLSSGSPPYSAAVDPDILTLTVRAPEPSTAILALGLMGTTLVTRRRR